MKQKLFTFKSGLLTKLLLSFTLLLTGLGNIWADDIVNGNSINTTYWDTNINNYYSTWNTSNSGYIQVGNWQTCTIVSKESIDWSSKKIVISAKGIGSNAQISVKKTSVDSPSRGDFSAHVTYGTSELGTSSTNDFGSFEINDIDGTYYLQFECKGVQIKSITTVTKSITTLSISPNSDAAFGDVWDNSKYVDYEITNNSNEAVTVDASIGGTNSDNFSVSPASYAIASKGSYTFRVSYRNYNRNDLCSKSATVTFIPGEDETNAITKNITAMSISNFTISSTDGAFGNVADDANKVYTITNRTGKAVSITPSITGSNADMFSVSPNEETEIANGESQEFTVTFDWQEDVNKLGNMKATIIFTPDDNDYDAFNIDASATATTAAVFDETIAPSYTSGTKSILILYTPKDGWNTICLPVAIGSGQFLSFMTSLFGSDSKAYSLADYKDNTLSFSKVSSLSLGKPYLVYVPKAASHPEGVVLKTYISPSAAGYTQPAETEAVFQGTYAPMAAGSLEGKYGVTGDGHIAKGGSGAFMRGYRAYFSLPDAGVHSLVFDDEGGETDLGFLKMVDENAKDVYTLTGQKVQKGRKGIYIVNGKKVVIK